MRPASSSYIGEGRRFTLGGIMRTIVLLPLSALVAVVVGCRTEAREQRGRSLPQRDLTLVTPTAEVEIASPVETQQPRIHHRTVRQASSREPKIILAAVAASAPVLAVPVPVAQPASTASTPANGRELLPGKTVTVIPASSGPSTDSDQTDELPPARGRTVVVGGGGTCRGRGRGPGIAGAPRPDFR
jgi:hypothetical protein